MHFDFDRIPGGIAYKLLVATVVPRPVAWVVTKSRAGIVNTAPFSFFNLMGDAPPTVALGITAARGGGLKHTARNILDTGEFVVNLVPFALVEAMNLTSIDAPDGVSEAGLAGLELAPSAQIAPPRLMASPVALECRLLHRLETGPGQFLLVGQVLGVHIEDRFLRDAERGHVDTQGLDLVARSVGQDYFRSGDVFRLDRPSWRDYSQKVPE